MTGCGLVWLGGGRESGNDGGRRAGAGYGRGLAGAVVEHAMAGLLLLPLLLNFIFTACEKFHKAQFHFPFLPLPGICPPRDGRATLPR